MPRGLAEVYERHIARQNEDQEQEIRNQAEQRRRDAEAAGRDVRNNLHDEEPTPSQQGGDTIRPEVPQRPQRRAPQPQPPTTPPASLLDEHGHGGEGDIDFQEILRNLQGQLEVRTGEYEESLREIERKNNQIHEMEGELQTIHERQLAANAQFRLAEANRYKEQYNQLREILTRTEEEKIEAMRMRDRIDRESNDLRQQLREAREELHEQQLREPRPPPEVIDDIRPMGESSIGQTRSNQDRLGERGSQRRRRRGYEVRSTWDFDSAGRPIHELTRPIGAGLGFIFS